MKGNENGEREAQRDDVCDVIRRDINEDCRIDCVVAHAACAQRARHTRLPLTPADGSAWSANSFARLRPKASVCRSGALAARATRRQMSPWARYVPAWRRSASATQAGLARLASATNSRLSETCSAAPMTTASSAAPNNQVSANERSEAR